MFPFKAPSYPENPIGNGPPSPVSKEEKASEREDHRKSTIRENVPLNPSAFFQRRGMLIQK